MYNLGRTFPMYGTECTCVCARFESLQRSTRANYRVRNDAKEYLIVLRVHAPIRTGNMFLSSMKFYFPTFFLVFISRQYRKVGSSYSRVPSREGICHAKRVRKILRLSDTMTYVSGREKLDAITTLVVLGTRQREN